MPLPDAPRRVAQSIALTRHTPARGPARGIAGLVAAAIALAAAASATIPAAGASAASPLPATDSPSPNARDQAASPVSPKSPLSARPAPERPRDPAALATFLRQRHAGEVIARVLIRDASDFARLEALGADQWTHGHRPGWNDYRLTAAQQAAAEALGLQIQIIRDDVADLIADEAARLAAAAADRAADDAVVGADFFDDYRSVADVEAFTDGLAAAHPGLASVAVIGESLEGRQIRVLTISGAGDPADKPSVVINAMQHAREWITVPTVLWFAERMLADYGVDPEVTAILDAIELHIVPITNPDGYTYSRDVERLWRKNRRLNSNGTFGVDLNRNWGFQWGGEGASSAPNSDIYRGTRPFSEPETTVLAGFITDRGDVAAHLDVHSFGQLILSPFGYDFVQPAGVDALTHDVLGRTFAEFIAEVSGSIYDPGPAWTLYLASGTCSDWAYGSADAISFTFELRPASAAGGGFILPPEQIIPTATENRVAFLDLCRAVAQGVRLEVASGLPEFLDATNPGPIELAALPIAAAKLDPSTARAMVRVGTGPLETVSLASGAEAGLFTLGLDPVNCGSTVAIAFAIDSLDGTTYRLPADAASMFEIPAFDRTIAFADDAESDQGWTVQNIAITGGAWDRGVPEGDGDRGDPTSDADGSGAAWLTGPARGNTDVDGGPTRLTSPALDLSGLDDPRLEVARWMKNDDGDEDRLRTLLSDDDGATWVEVDAVNNLVDWTPLSIRVADHVVPSATVRIRFEVSDNPNNSVTEAGVDAISVFSLGCPGSGADIDGDGTVDFDDLTLVVGNWGPCDGCPADVDGDGVVGLGDLLAVLSQFS